MINNGAVPFVVSKRLGHAKPSITMDIYGHLIPIMQEGIAELMDNLMNPAHIELQARVETNGKFSPDPIPNYMPIT